MFINSFEKKREKTHFLFICVNKHLSEKLLIFCLKLETSFLNIG